MESQFGVDLGHVRVHTGPESSLLNRDIGARAFTLNSDIFFAQGEGPGQNQITAHELVHIVQQAGGAQGTAAFGPISARAGGVVQRTLNGTYPIDTGHIGAFEVDMRTRQGAPAAQSGLDGYIRFVPAIGAPNSNVIVFVQIVRLTDGSGTDVTPASLSAAAAPRGPLRGPTTPSPGKRTQADPARGVEGGFFTDRSRVNAASPTAGPGDALPPSYGWRPVETGEVAQVGQTEQPAIYGGGIGGVFEVRPGFKRSNDPADIRSVALYDFPGTNSNVAPLDFEFESVAKGEDTGVVYGGVLWGFKIRLGRVIDEYISIEPGQSATFDEALERHRDFYVHEPATIYFEFDRADLGIIEMLKILSLLPYLGRNPDIHMSIEGFADIEGGPGRYNDELSRRRALAVRQALVDFGVDPARIDSPVIRHGASINATLNAGTGDQGGSPLVGGDQTREANRWANRRVVITFRHVPAAAPAGPAAGP